MFMGITKYCGIFLIVLLGFSMQTLYASEVCETKVATDNFDAEFEAAFAETIDAKMIVNTFCTKCHKINQIVNATNRRSHEWLKILSSSAKMGPIVKQSLTPEEIIEVSNYLVSSKQALEALPVNKEGQKENLDPANKSYIASK